MRILGRRIILLLVGLFSLSLLTACVQSEPNSLENTEVPIEKKMESDKALETEPVELKLLTTGKIGMAVIPLNYQETEESWQDAFQKARHAGVQVVSAGCQWSETEKSPGVFDWSSFKKMFVVMKEMNPDFEVTFDIGGPFFHTESQAPSDLTYKILKDSELIKRYKAFLTSFLTEFSDIKIPYLVVHAEGATSYFREHPEQVEDFGYFLEEVRRHVQSYNSDIQVGINTDPHNKDNVLSRLATYTDFMAYDIARNEELMTDPNDLEKLTVRLLKLSNGKPIAFQNAGWSTSSAENSSEEQQAQFFKNLFETLQRHRDDMHYVSLYTVYDEDVVFMRKVYQASFSDLPADFVEKMVQANGRFGLFKEDGTPKLAWETVLQEVGEYYNGH